MAVRLGLAAVVAIAAVAFFAAPALADTQPDPQLTNIPYLAWRGEEVRLVKCEPDIFLGLDAAQRQAIAQSAQFSDVFVDFLLVDWSGDPNVVKPQLEPGTVSMFFRSFDDSPCVAATVVSQKAGLAQFKLVVTFNFSLAVGFPVDFPEVITIKHDFNVAWMNINQAVTSVVQGGTTDVAGGAGNQIQVLVNGTIPLLSNYGELGLGDQITMPDDWASLANVMATFRDPLDPNPAMRWDIHDEFSPTASPDADQHGAQSSCTHNTTAFIDTVDNCTGEPFPLDEAIPENAPIPVTNFEVGLFSRVWQGFTAPTIGPFDPQRPQMTLLSNGILDKGDAPMPAALINFQIASNSGAPGDISGVGSLCTVNDNGPPPVAPGECLSADKHVVYSRNGLGTGDIPHNLYGPFYASWIPSTGPYIILGLSNLTGFPLPPLSQQVIVPEASGVSGPANVSRFTCGKGNNFPGFLNQCAYHFWDVNLILGCGATGFNGTVGLPPPFFQRQACLPTEATPSGCLPVIADPAQFDDIDLGAPLPFGAQHVDVYTDEHGEARVNFSPGTSFFFLNLPGVAINANGGCDLAKITTLGTAAITATAKYPFEPVTARPVVSNTITKTVTSAFSKSITCFPKGSQPEEQNAAICVAEAHDITGAPFVGETVCFFADFNAEDIQYFAGAIPGTNIVIGDEGRNAAAEAQGLRRICPFTDEHGRAAVEIFNTNPTTVDVSALFVDEGILRHILVPFPITGQVGPATGVQANVSSPPNTTNNNTNTSNNTTNGSKPNTAKPAKLVISKVKLTRQGRTRATLRLRVSGPQGKVPVRVRFQAKTKVAKGKRVITVTKMVATNRMVTLRKLRTPNAKRLGLKVSLVS